MTHKRCIINKFVEEKAAEEKKEIDHYANTNEQKWRSLLGQIR